MTDDVMSMLKNWMTML